MPACEPVKVRTICKIDTFLPHYDRCLPADTLCIENAQSSAAFLKCSLNLNPLNSGIIFDVLIVLGHFFYHRLFKLRTMFKNYFRTAFRNLKKNKGFFALNFIGLYISVVVCVLIALIIIHETSFDKRPGSNVNIYRVVENSSSATGKTYSAVTPYPLATAMRAAMSGEQLISQVHFDRGKRHFFRGQEI